jgi:hypothetical protein
VVWYSIYIVGTDGGGATDLTITAPIVPADLDIDIPALEGVKTIDTTETTCGFYLDAADNTAENRKFKLRNPGTFTDDAALAIRAFGFYPLSGATVNGWTSFTPSETWTTGTPASITKAGFYKVVDDFALVLYQTSSADSNACTALSVAAPINNLDINAHMAAGAIQLNDTTYSNPLAYLDCNDAAQANRALTFRNFSTVADGAAVKVSVAAILQVAPWLDWAAAATPSWSVAPASVAEVAKYTVRGNLCIALGYLSSSDGNAASTLTLTLPVVPAYSNGKVAIANYQTQHSDTNTHCMAYIDTTQAAAASRLVNLDNMTACDDGEACTFSLVAVYPIDR